MKLRDFCIDLRKDLIGLISGIDDAGYSLYWDNTTPNYVTKRKLRDVLQSYAKAASAFGVYVVSRHACSNKEHEEIEEYYLVTNGYGLEITYDDPEYVWNEFQLGQRSDMSPCPCSLGKPANEHYIIQDIIFSKDTDMVVAQNLASILSDIHEAIEQAGDKQPRSGIREYLLRAVLRLNDLILPTPVEEYIGSLRAGTDEDE